MPKGVLWRNGDAMIECFGGSPDGHRPRRLRRRGRRRLPRPDRPAVHARRRALGRAQRLARRRHRVRAPPVPSASIRARSGGPSSGERIDFLLIVGDAFARPLLDELGAGSYDPSSLNVLMSGGAAAVGRLQDASCSSRLPTLMVVDGMGSSEAGGQLAHVSTGSRRVDRHVRRRARATTCCPPTSAASLAPGDDELGWLAKSGRLALGYLGDAAKTARTYPGRRRRPLRRAGRSGPLAGRRHHRAARPRLRDDQLRRREDLRRGGRAAPSRPTPTSTTASSPAGRASAGAARWWRSSAGGTGADVTPRRPARRRRRPHRPLQAAQGHRVRRRDRALPVRQGRLPLGPRRSPRPHSVA